MREKEISEGLGELADIAERDHEVQMARADLYKSAKYAIKLHEMLKGVSEAEGLEGWVQSKITKASEMLGSVYHHMDYEESGLADEAMVVGESQRDTHCSDKCCGADVKREDCECAPDCEHCNCNDTSIPEGNRGRMKKKKSYKEELQAKLENAKPKMDVTDADKNANTPAYKRMKAGDTRYNDKTTKDKKTTEGTKKFKSSAHRKAVHAAKASGKR